MTELEQRAAESIRAFNAADWEALALLWDPAGAIVPPAGWPEGGEIQGWDAIQSQFERLKADLSEERIESPAIEEVSQGVVLCAFSWAGRGASSGLEFDRRIWMVERFRDGLIARAEYFLDEGAARAAAGA